MREFSEIAKELRESKHLTQTQLAERMWVKKSIISAYETDARPPSLDLLIKYAKEFNVSTDYLLGIESNKAIKVDNLTDAQINILNDLINEFIKKNKE
ncbi:MAG: helix-turn-helix transcriptional regulator [Clostridia bacterium]|nr:helix-turn-helix transcriptional regulator [Clostridia bacterium]